MLVGLSFPAERYADRLGRQTYAHACGAYRGSQRSGFMPTLWLPWICVRGWCDCLYDLHSAAPAGQLTSACFGQLSSEQGCARRSVIALRRLRARYRHVGALADVAW